MNLKLYRPFFIALAFMLVVVSISFFQYKKSYFSAKSYRRYDELKIKCKDSYDDYICKLYGITDKESYEREIKNNIYKQREELDIRNLGFTVLEFYLFYYVSIFMPLITAILVCLMVSRDTNTGFYQHVLSRESYKKYIFDKVKSISICALVQPISILSIFIISGFLTKFNFSAAKFYSGLAIYSPLKEHHFFFSIFLMMLISFLVNFIFGIVSATVTIKEKSSIVAIIKSYLICVVMVVVDYFAILMSIASFVPKSWYSEIAMTVSFDVLNNYLLQREMILPLVFFNLFLLFSISCFFFFRKYKRKEKFYAAIERENTSI